MAQWDNQKLVSQRSRVRLQAVLVFILSYQELNKRKIKIQEIKSYYLYCIVWGPSVIYNMYKSMSS